MRQDIRPRPYPLGFVSARDLLGEDYSVISVIGDGAMTGGLAYEALNNASRSKGNYIIVLNDNEMSISPNVGGVSAHLASLRTSERYLNLKEDVTKKLSSIPKYGERMVQSISRTKSGLKQLMIQGMIFENLGIKYLGPFDGHDVSAMVKVFKEARNIEGAVVIHVVTKKGYGYFPARRHPERFHGTPPFDIETGTPKKKKDKPTYTDVFSATITRLGESNERLVCITAAMEDGVGLKRFHGAYPERFFDVGIAEEHAIVFGAGMASMGMKPVFAVYSSFLQRGFDEIALDICLQKLPVVLCIDRAGIVGADGETHQGIFDISYLGILPNMVVMAPKNKHELIDMIKFAVAYEEGPIAVRYPRGEAYDGLETFRAPVEMGRAEYIYRGAQVALFALGSMVETACRVRELLMEDGIECTVVNARFAKPLDTGVIRELLDGHDVFVTLEENVESGGFGQAVLGEIGDRLGDKRFVNISLPDRFVEHGDVGQLKCYLGIDADSVAERIRGVYGCLKNEKTT